MELSAVAAYAGPATRQAPDDLAAAIAAEPDAQAMFDVLTSANRFALIHRVESMKRADSRARKISEMLRSGDGTSICQAAGMQL